MQPTLRFRVSHVMDQKDSKLRVLYLKPKDDIEIPTYQSGQYAMVTFSHFTARPYSIASKPSDDTLQFHIRNSGSGASYYATHDLQIGDECDVSLPYGDTVFIPNDTRHLVLIAGGSGLAPIYSILHSALEENPNRSIGLYFGVRHADDFYLQETLQNLAEAHPQLHLHLIVSDTTDTPYRHGLVGDIFAQDDHDIDNMRLYTAGPVEMIKHVYEVAREKGLAREFFHTDLDLK
jgi:NAD(P)H-flavin reductase